MDEIAILCVLLSVLILYMPPIETKMGTDKELDKVNAELNEVNDELERGLSERESMKHEIDKVNTLLHETLKLVHKVEHKVSVQLRSHQKIDALEIRVGHLKNRLDKDVKRIDKGMRNILELSKQFEKQKIVVSTKIQRDVDAIV